VVAPSLIPQRPGDRVKTNRRDAVSLAKLHRAGELTPVWVPDVGHEAIRELVRAREGAMEALRRARQQLLSFLLRHGRVYTGRTPWSKAHSSWLCGQTFEHPAHQIVLAEYRHAIEEAEGTGYLPLCFLIEMRLAIRQSVPAAEMRPEFEKAENRQAQA